MEENTFKTLYRRLVDRCELPPEVAEKLLQRILAILQGMGRNEHDQIHFRAAGQGEKR